MLCREEEMGCRKSGDSEDGGAISASLSNALLFTTMCIIGLPVDVHVKDGSIYSGIFHTARVDNDYAIVLKKARMTKNGKCDANVTSKGVIETLVVLSEDLVQVVAKEVLLSAKGIAGNANWDAVGASAGNGPSTGCKDRISQTINCSKQNVDKNRISQTRSSSRTEKGFGHGYIPKMTSQSCNECDIENGKTICTDLAKKEAASHVAVDARQVGGGGSQRKQGDHDNKSEYRKEQNVLEVQVSKVDASDIELNAVTNIQSKMTKVLPNGVHDSPAPFVVERRSSEDIPCSGAVSSGLSAAFSPVVDATSDACISSSSMPTQLVPPKSSSSKKTTKEFKLNPGARIFSPSFAHRRPVTPPAVPTATSVAYIPDCSMMPITTAQPEEISPYAHCSLPLKVVPYNVATGNGGSDFQYSQPIVGHLGSRAPPIRYAGQYHPVQAGTGYVHPTSQNVMVGRLGPLVYVHPVSHDVVQGAPAFSQVSTSPLLIPHPVHLPKHQGSAAAQALQLCSAPPFVAAGQQPFVVPSHIPISQPHFPVMRPMPVPGSNSFLGSKFL